MTEEEAKAKPCIGPAPTNTGRLTHPNEQGVAVFVCRGSACLAWRWEPYLDRISAGGGWRTGRMGVEPIAGTVGAELPDDSISTSWSQTMPNPNQRHGFCGLAGKP